MGGHDTVLGRRVALKVLVQELADDPRATRRFVREARATAKLTHPNVTRVYDFGRDGGVPFLVMELLEGDTLADRLAGGPLPPSEAARIGAAVADALDAAHSRGIIHRDIKPSNVLMTPAGEVKVMDFGIAAAADETPFDHRQWAVWDRRLYLAGAGRRAGGHAGSRRLFAWRGPV